jgi:hypothetical protein
MTNNPFLAMVHKGDAFLLAHAFRSVNCEQHFPDGVALDQLYCVLRMIHRITFSSLTGYLDGVFAMFHLESTPDFMQVRDAALEYLEGKLAEERIWGTYR